MRAKSSKQRCPALCILLKKLSTSSSPSWLPTIKSQKFKAIDLKAPTDEHPCYTASQNCAKKIPRCGPSYLLLALRSTNCQKTWHEFLVSWQEKATTMSEIRKTLQNLSHLLPLTMMNKWCLLMLSPFSKNTHRIGCRNRKKLARSFGQFGRNHFLVSGGYLQRPSNLLKCYQLNL